MENMTQLEELQRRGRLLYAPYVKEANLKRLLHNSNRHNIQKKKAKTTALVHSGVEEGRATKDLHTGRENYSRFYHGRWSVMMNLETPRKVHGQGCAMT